MHALIFIHRWLGIPFSLLFAMWFATGIVMHFVPFPTLTEAERIEGLAVVNPAQVEHGPANAVLASKISDTTRVRLVQRSDGPVYLVSGTSRVTALHAADLSSAAIESEHLALSIAVDHARRRGMYVAQTMFAELAHYDQWTVPNGLDLHRPLYRIALNDGTGTELYVSSTTGEVVRDTTRSERWWNYAGSVVHWIYPTALRRNWAAWDAAVWWLSLIALFATISGVLLGTLRIRVTRNHLVSPYRSWHGWHHWLGLICMTFVLTWIFSGWLSMDHGRIFSDGKLTEAEATTASNAPAWDALSTNELQRSSTQAREIEWFPFDRRIYRRERIGLSIQHLFLTDVRADVLVPEREFLEANEISAVASRLAPGCKAAVAVDARDNYAITATMPNAPVYRSECGDVWFHFDGASGTILEKLDTSRRAYRWFYSALHTLDIPALTARPTLRTVLIVMLCGLGLAFSLTGVVIGWRRLGLEFRRAR
jgi:uncharacterized iron-regulated membrane protein